MDRRTFLLANLGLAAGASAGAQGHVPVTLRQWLDASPDERERARTRLVERIPGLDKDIQAWVQVRPQPPAGRGAMLGVPFGVKDIIETEGLATEYGSPIYKGRVGAADAAIVRLLRERGGVVMGKTHTTAFAYRTPAPTRNPRNLAHTPGGSSSGSAAAVAADMVPFALGTQTGGSVLRPASYCGVTGFKPTHDLLPMEGVLPFAKSLDTLGFFTHSAADMLALWDAIGHPTGEAGAVSLAAPDPLPEVEPAMAAVFRDGLARLRAGGAAIQTLDLAATLVGLRDAQRTVMFYEGARFHEQRYAEHGDRLAHMAGLVREGLRIPAAAYDQALAYIAARRRDLVTAYQTTPVILVPAATGPAPAGLESTGDSSMNAPWTALGTPAITIPLPVTSGLPLGLQLTAAPGRGATVLQTAVALERLRGSRR